MAVDNEIPKERTMTVLKREPKPTNRMAGDADKKTGERAMNHALAIVVIAWLVVFVIPFSLRDFRK